MPSGHPHRRAAVRWLKKQCRPSTGRYSAHRRTVSLALPEGESPIPAVVARERMTRAPACGRSRSALRSLSGPIPAWTACATEKGAPTSVGGRRTRRGIRPCCPTRSQLRPIHPQLHRTGPRSPHIRALTSTLSGPRVAIFCCSSGGATESGNSARGWRPATRVGATSHLPLVSRKGDACSTGNRGSGSALP